ELALHRSRLATDTLERRSWRRIATERAAALTSWDNAYPRHTIVKAAVDDVRELLRVAEETQSDADVAQLGDAIVTAEQAIKRGLEAFPTNSHLLTQEGEFSNILSQAHRAETAFQRAFASNPRSTLIARRLSRIQRAKGANDAAIMTLRK